MAVRKKVLRPVYDDDDEDNELGNVLMQKNSHQEEVDDDLSTLSFGALNSAQKKLNKTTSKSRKNKHISHHDDSSSSLESLNDGSEGWMSDSDSDSDAPPQESSSARKHSKDDQKKKKSKHAPAEALSKKPVSKVRKIPGLDINPKYSLSNLYGDIRFDATYGKSDLMQTRKNYAFLDEYRQQEIQSMQSILKDKKSAHMLSDYERQDIEQQLQSLKSRLDTMKNRDLEQKILSDHKREQMAKFKEGGQSRPYFLKKSEKRKLIQKARFESMKSSQREKVMERKRKKRLGKEFRQLEFNRPPQ
jgi:ribosomal RNA-processing protein 36